MFPLHLQKTFRALWNSKLWESLDLSVTLGSLEAHHFERTVAYLAWETRSNSLYLEKSKNKILMPEFLAISKAHSWIREGTARIQHTTQNGAVLCLISVYHCCVSEDLIYHLLLGGLTSPEGPLWVPQKFLCMLSLGYCYPSSGASQGQSVQRNMPTTCATYTLNCDWKDQ